MKRSYTYLKGLLTLALAAFTGWMWAAELVIPYTFDGKTGNTEYAYEYQVQMPNTTLTSFTTTVRFASGDHRVEIISVKLLDGETTYTAVATGTEGPAADTQEGSYSGTNNYNNVYTFTNNAGFTANKAYTLQAMLKVTNDSPSHNGNIKVSDGITRYVPSYSFGVNFTTNNSNVATDSTLGYAAEGYAAPAAWTNVAGASGGYTSIAAPNAMSYTLTWSANGGWNSGNAKNSDAKKLLYGYLDDVAANARKKASVTITGLPAGRKYAVAVILSGDGADNKDAFNNVYSPVLINGQTYSYDVDGNLLTGEAAMAATTWGDRRASASTDGTLTLGKNVMFVKDLSGGELTITSALDTIQVSRLTIAGIQVWISEETVTSTPSASALPEGAEVISINFDDSNDGRKVTGSAGIYTVDGWNNISGASGSASSLTVSDGTTQLPQDIDFSFSSNNSYSWDSATDAFLKGYLDDGGNHAHVTLSNIPFEKYSVIVYTATDSGTDHRFATVQINNKVYIGTPYATSIGYAAEVEGMGAIWGRACQTTAAYGVNALRVDGLSGNLSIQGGGNANNARGGIAAIQIINTGDSIFSDVQEIDWTEQAAANMKVSNLPELTKPVVELTLPAGATLIVDTALPVDHLFKIIGDNVTVNITNWDIEKSAVEAVVSGATVTTAYTDTIGVEIDGFTYSYFFRGTTDANYGTVANWYTGKRVMGDQTKWYSVSGDVAPGVGGNMWHHMLLDGDMMDPTKVTVGEDNYKTISATVLEGWNLGYFVRNGVHLNVATLNKIQNGDGFTAVWRVDDTSKITIGARGNSQHNNLANYYINNEEGIVFTEFDIADANYYFDEDGSVKLDGVSGTQTIKAITLDLGTADEGCKIVSRKVIGFNSSTATYTVEEGAVTTNVEGVDANDAVSLRNVGDYKFVKKNDGYYVNFVAYAATNEIGAASIWTATEDDTNWNTETNWTGGIPVAGADAVISIATDTTITIPAEGVMVGVLTVNGEGTLTIDGGKLTAGMILANTSITAGEGTLALAPMNIAEGKTVTYAIDTNGEQKVPALTGAGIFAKAGTGMLTIDKDNACDASITVNAGTLRFHEHAYSKTYNIVAKDGAKIQVGTWTGCLTSTSNTLKLEGGAMLSLRNGNGTNGSTINGTIVIASTAAKPAVIEGSISGPNTDIVANVKGNGVLEIQNTGNPIKISGVIADGDTENDTLQVKITQTNNGVTFTGANTYSGGTIVAEGAVLTAPMRSATPMEINGTLVVSYNASQVKLHENNADYSQITGTGKIRIVNTSTNNGWVSLPNDDKVFASTLALELEANNGLILTDTDGAYTFGTLSGSKGFRVDWQDGGRSVKILQAANSEHTGTLVTDDAATRLTKIVVAGAEGATEKTLTLSGDTSTPARPLEVDATGSVNITGSWGGDVDAYGVIAGTGSIGGKLKLQNGSTLDVSAGALNVTGQVWVVNAATNTATVKLPAEYAVDTPIISCSNAEAVAVDLSAKMPTGYKCVADGNTIKLAVTVNVTIPTAPANTKWYYKGAEVSGTIAVDPNTDVTLTLKANEGYVFADGSTEKEVVVNSGAAGATVETPNVTAATPVAQVVGGNKYQTLAAAIAAAQAGDTVTLLATVTASDTLTIAANTTIDLNGKILTSTADPAIHVTGGTLTLTGAGYIMAPYVVIQQGTKNAGLTTKVVVGESVNLTSFRDEGEDGDGDNVVLLYGKATLESAGNLLTYSKGYAAIQGSGGDAGADTSITITGGQVFNNGDVAIYQPQAGTLTITGGTISGSTAIYAKAGTISISGGAFWGTGAEEAYASNGNGATATGDALVIDNDNRYAPLTVTITGGQFSSENAEPIASYSNVSTDVLTGFVSNGKFNKAIAGSLCADGKCCVANSDAATSSDYPWTIGTLSAISGAEIDTPEAKDVIGAIIAADTSSPTSVKVIAGTKSGAALPPAEVADALAIFGSSVTTTATESDTLKITVSYDFGIDSMTQTESGIVITAKVQKPNGAAAAFADGVTVTLVDETDDTFFATATLNANGTATFPAKRATELVGRKLKVKATK